MRDSLRDCANLIYFYDITVTVMVKKYMKQILLTVFLNWEQFQHNSEEISASEEILVEYPS